METAAAEFFAQQKTWLLFVPVRIRFRDLSYRFTEMSTRLSMV